MLEPRDGYIPGMPELPDVEGFKKIIDDHCLGKEVRSVDTGLQPGQKTRTLQMGEPEFAAAATGRRWAGSERRGKFLIVSQDDGNRLVLHFMLTGALVYRAPADARGSVPSARVAFGFTDGSELIFVDRRNMGRIFWVEDGDFSTVGVLSRLGVEPLSGEFTKERWRQIVGSKGRSDKQIKELLCDQEALAGIGNVYADQILWQVRVRPDRRAGSLSPGEVDRLHSAIVEVLRQGVQAVRKGERLEGMLSTRRQGAPCPRCGRPVSSLPRRGTHSYFCSQCQK
jgi:formamidopyrimidine-DNA glycosylase